MDLLRAYIFIFILIKCLIVFIDARYVFARPLDGLGARIIGGQAATPHQHPFMVSLQLRFLWVRAHFCGGSILNNNWVLTAGHCVTESWLIRWLNIDAVAGAHDVNRFTSDVQIQRIVQRLEHPNYMGGIGPHDIAMLKTKNPFVFSKKIQPINLPLNNMDLSKGLLQLAGWGALDTTTFLPQLPSVLQELNATYVPLDECFDQLKMFLEENDGYNPLDKQSNICTGPLDGGTAACVGDSGGPLILVNNVQQQNTDNENTIDIDEDNQNERDNIKLDAGFKREEYLVGIVSWGVDPCGEAGAPTVYTEVSKYLDFIKSYINT